MKTTTMAIVIAINVTLLVGIIYLHYFAPLPGEQVSQQVPLKRPGPVKKVAIIAPTESRTTISAIIDGLKNSLAKEALFTPEIRVYNANDSRTLMRSNVDAAIKHGADVLVSLGSQATQMTKELTEKREALIPVVFAATGDPLRLELIHNPQSSGNHLTGVSVIGLDWIEQMVDLIPVTMPWVKNVFIPYDPTGFGGALEEYVVRYTAALEKHGYKVTTSKIYATNEVGDKVAPFIDEADLMIVLPDAVVVDAIDQLVKLSEQYGTALYAALNLGLLPRGVTFAFGYNTYDIGVAATAIIRQIIEQGKQPTNIPIDQMQNTYRIGLNVDNARRQGVLDKIDESVVFLMENGKVI